MRIEAFVVPPLANNVYIVYEDGSEDSIIIDVAMGSKPIIERICELELKVNYIVNTHGHADHTVEDQELRAQTRARLAIHELDAYRLAATDEAARSLGLVLRPIEPDVQLVNGQVLTYGKTGKLSVIHTPGHTEGSICLYEADNQQLFSGDTLFANGYGRVDGMGSDPRAMKESLKRILSLPKSVEIYPGHGAFTNMRNEAAWLEEALSSTAC
jgi:hydroxyacylglutathione hydrolase